MKNKKVKKLSREDNIKLITKAPKGQKGDL